MRTSRTKGLAVLLCLMLAAGLAGCGSLQASLVLEKAEARWTTVYSSQGEKTDTLTISGAGWELEREIAASYRQTYATAETRTHISGEVTDNGESFTYESYERDGYTYFIDRGARYKISSEASAQWSADGLRDSDFLSVSVTDADGGKRLRFTLDPQAVGGQLEPQVLEFFSFLNPPVTGARLTALVYEVEYDEEYLPRRERLEGSAVLALEDGGELTADYRTEMVYQDFNTFGQIQFPAGLADFPDLSWD